MRGRGDCAHPAAGVSGSVGTDKKAFCPLHFRPRPVYHGGSLFPDFLPKRSTLAERATEIVNMATSAGFKQQCPSCEAMVPVRDPSFVGKKIDCPKCKYRFVVEDPDVGKDDELDEPKPAKTPKKPRPVNGVTARRPVNAKGAAGRAAPRDDDDEPPPKKKAGGPSPVLLLGIGLGVVAVIGLVVAGILIFGGDDPKPNTNNNPPPAPKPVEAQPQPDKTPAYAGKDITNLLPNDSDFILRINLDKAFEGQLGSIAFKSAGTFSESAFRTKLGISLAEIEDFVTAMNVKDNWRFSVIRASRVIDKNDLTTRLALAPAPDSPLGGMPYYVIGADLDSFSNTLFTDTTKDRKTSKPEPLYAHLLDERTLVVAHMAPMKKFLEDKGQPQYLTQEGAAAGGQAQGQGGGGPPGPGKGGGAAPGGMGGGPPGGGMAPGGGPPGGGMAPGGGPPGGGMGPGGPPGGGMGPGGPGMGGPGRPGGGQQQPQASTSFMTIRPALKGVLDKVEASPSAEKEPILLTYAMDGETMRKIAKIDNADEMIPDGILGLESMSIATSLHVLRANRLIQVDALEIKNDQVAVVLNDQARQALALAIALGLKVKFGIDATVANQQQQGFGPGRMGGGPDGPGMMGGPQGGPGMPGFGQQGGPAPGAGGMPGFGQQGGPPPGFQGGPPGGPQGGPGAPRPGQAAPGSTSTVRVDLQQFTLVIRLDLALNDQAWELIREELQSRLIRYKGQAEMLTQRSRVHELADALAKYVQGKKQFPRGTAKREPSPERAGLPWPPDERVSWMVEVLPLLGEGEFQELYNQIDRDKSWREGVNALNATALVPHFLSKEAPMAAWWIPYPGMTKPVAATHFVGIAGIGLDAASYDPADPAAKDKIGVFGYDRETKWEDLKKPECTIAVLQVPTADTFAYRAPWLAGGGATVRGVPEEDSVAPFICEGYAGNVEAFKGKRGTYAIMANGDVRFIPHDIPNDVFKKMCSLTLAEQIDNLDELAPKVPRPQVQLKANPPPPPPPPPPTPKKEEEKPKPAAPQAGGAPDAKVVAALQRNCGACHTAPMVKGKTTIFVSQGVYNPDAPKKEMAEALAGGKMPPKRPGAPQPSADDLAAIQEWLKGAK